MFVSIICECCYREVLESNLTTSEDGSTSSLILTPNRDEDGGQYLCQVSDGRNLTCSEKDDYGDGLPQVT